MMTKKDAIDLFGSVRNIALAMGTSTQNIHMYTDPLTRATTDRIIGAATRHGIKIPKRLLKNGC